jgi:hypothetical protein
VDKIQTIMRAAMKDDIHYGVIPGTEKPTLFKAGAEKLCLTFRLAPSFEIRRQDLDGEHREYEVTCTLKHIATDQILGQDVGSCSTLESKYRFRRGEPESTGKPVPPPYWNLRKTNPAKAQELLGGKDLLPKKIEGAWMICKKASERFENPDIADCHNTVLKMAKKRALVDATLTATAASDCFTHEELEEEEIDEAPAGRTRREPQAARETQTPDDDHGKGSSADQKPETSFKPAVWEVLCERYDKNRAAAELKRLTGKSSLSELSEQQAKDALLWFEDGDGREPDGKSLELK